MSREHTCIKDDGGTPNRRCDACEEEKAMQKLPPDDVLDLYVPGRLRCPKCSFELTKATIFVQSGSIGASKAEVYQVGEPCPNDGTLMVRVLWREEADANRKYAERLIEEILQASGANSLPAAMEQLAASRHPGQAGPVEPSTTLAASWERFSEEERHAQVEVGPARRAFYAGAQTLCAVMASALDDEIDEEQSSAQLDAVYEELKQAVEEMKL